MTEKQSRFLNHRLRKCIKQQPEIEILRNLLLEIGGLQLVAPPEIDASAPLLITAGFVMAGPVQCKIMKESACHNNIARVWRKKQRGLIGIGVGYALSDDGLWRQHSWGVLREGVLETTVERTKYFGILLQQDDADSFAQSGVL